MAYVSLPIETVDNEASRYIQSWSELLAPLVNMIKEGCENLSALLILLIFY